MDLVHFDDLTKINVQWAFLNDDTQQRLMAHKGAVEKYTKRGWRHHACDTAFHTALYHPCVTYRAKPTPLTKPSPPWEHLADWVRYVARDADQLVFGFSGKPYVECDVWVSSSNDDVETLAALKFDPGTCDWRDSLVRRPEGL